MNHIDSHQYKAISYHSESVRDRKGAQNSKVEIEVRNDLMARRMDGLKRYET